MKTIILSILALFIGSVSFAQSGTASLNITLTDVQSVSFGNLSLNNTPTLNQEISQKDALQMLSRTTSQVKKIDPQNIEYERIYKEFYAGLSGGSTLAATAKSTKNIANRPSSAMARPQQTSNLVIYQVDPR